MELKDLHDTEGTYCTNSYKGKKHGNNRIRQSWTQNLVLHYFNFCENTSIHGYKFFGERKRNNFEKLYWFVVILGAIFGSSYLIYNTYRQWVTSPIIVTFAKTETPIWNIPFPAVTICPETAISQSLFNLTDTYLKYRNNITTTEEDDKLFKIFSLMCNEDLEFINETETKYLSTWEIMDLYLSFSDPGLNYCTWMGNKIDCMEKLSLLRTSEGICMTFNMLEEKEVYLSVDETFGMRKLNIKTKLWTLEEGYPPSAGLNAYPRRTFISGVKGGFQVDFGIGEDAIDYLCSDIQGYKIALHHPAEAPNMDRFFRVPLDQVVIAAIKPRMITTSDKIKTYKPEDRQCYVPGEKNLTTFRIYSQQNCLFDCIVKFTLNRCGCLPFYVTGAGEKVCGAGSKRCINKSKVEFLQQELSFKLQNGQRDVGGVCNCLPACTSIEFDSEISQTDWDWKKEHRMLHTYSDAYYTKNHRSRLIVYYKDLQFMRSERHELYGTVDFLANCGGLLGLCCGFSFTSLMEIIYYLTLRLWSNIYKFGCKVWV